MSVARWSRTPGTPGSAFSASLSAARAFSALNDTPTFQQSSDSLGAHAASSPSRDGSGIAVANFMSRLSDYYSGKRAPGIALNREKDDSENLIPEHYTDAARRLQDKVKVHMATTGDITELALAVVYDQDMPPVFKSEVSTLVNLQHVLDPSTTLDKFFRGFETLFRRWSPTLSLEAHARTLLGQSGGASSYGRDALAGVPVALLVDSAGSHPRTRHVPLPPGALADAETDAAAKAKRLLWRPFNERALPLLCGERGSGKTVAALLCAPAAQAHVLALYFSGPLIIERKDVGNDEEAFTHYRQAVLEAAKKAVLVLLRLPRGVSLSVSINLHLHIVFDNLGAPPPSPANDFLQGLIGCHRMLAEQLCTELLIPGVSIVAAGAGCDGSGLPVVIPSALYSVLPLGLQPADWATCLIVPALRSHYLTSIQREGGQGTERDRQEAEERAVAEVAALRSSPLTQHAMLDLCICNARFAALVASRLASVLISTGWTDDANKIPSPPSLLPGRSSPILSSSKKVLVQVSLAEAHPRQPLLALAGTLLRLVAADLDTFVPSEQSGLPIPQTSTKLLRSALLAQFVSDNSACFRPISEEDATRKPVPSSWMPLLWKDGLLAYDQRRRHFYSGPCHALVALVKGDLINSLLNMSPKSVMTGDDVTISFATHLALRSERDAVWAGALAASRDDGEQDFLKWETRGTLCEERWEAEDEATLGPFNELLRCHVILNTRTGRITKREVVRQKEVVSFYRIIRSNGLSSYKVYHELGLLGSRSSICRLILAIEKPRKERSKAISLALEGLPPSVCKSITTVAISLIESDKDEDTMLEALLTSAGDTDLLEIPAATSNEEDSQDDRYTLVVYGDPRGNYIMMPLPRNCNVLHFRNREALAERLFPLPAPPLTPPRFYSDVGTTTWVD